MRFRLVLVAAVAARALLAQGAMGAVGVLIGGSGVGQQPAGTAGQAGAQRQMGGQQPAAPAPVYSAEDLASVSGVVSNAVTGEPLARASVRLMGAGATVSVAALDNAFFSVEQASGTSSTVSATTDAAGAFLLTGVRPGTYRLVVSRANFSSASGQGGRGGGAVATITLAKAQKVSGVAVRLMPNGVISGRVVDEDGEPTPYAQVSVLTRRYVGGRRQMIAASGGNSATTNDLGEFRLFDIPPGRYYLRAIPAQNAGAGAVERLAASFYPSGQDVDRAAPLEIAAGQQLRDVNFRLIRQRAVHVRGKVADNSGGQTPLAGVMLTPRDSAAGSASSAALDRQGAFDLYPVLPGSYFLTANVRGANRSGYTVRKPLEVANGDVSGVIFSISPPANITGKVKLEGEGELRPGSLRVVLRGDDLSAGVVPSSRVDEQMAFAALNVIPEKYTVLVTGMPEGYYLKSVRQGGAEMQWGALDLSNGGTAQLEVTVSSKAGRVAGFVQDQRGDAPTAGATVALVPAEAERRKCEAHYYFAPANGSGAFSIPALFPGRYLAFGVDRAAGLENSTFMDPEFFHTVERYGEAFSVEEGGRATVQVKLIPAEALK